MAYEKAKEAIGHANNGFFQGDELCGEVSALLKHLENEEKLIHNLFSWAGEVTIEIAGVGEDITIKLGETNEVVKRIEVTGHSFQEALDKALKSLEEGKTKC